MLETVLVCEVWRAAARNVSSERTAPVQIVSAQIQRATKKGTPLMPALTQQEREQLLGPHGGECPTCQAVRVRQYCRTCDEFFLECRCGQCAAAGPHMHHRTYRWVAGQIIANPDFDRLLR